MSIILLTVLEGVNKPFSLLRGASDQKNGNLLAKYIQWIFHICFGGLAADGNYTNTDKSKPQLL